MSRARAELVDVGQLAAARTALSLEWAPEQLPRLADRIVAGAAGHVRARLAFRSEGGWSIAEGEIAGELTLTCQRCLAAMRWALAAPCAVAFVPDEAGGAGVPPAYDPFVCAAESVSLAALVEEEILLALPMVARHGEHEACGAQAPQPERPNAPAKATAAETEETVQRPFANLRDWLGK